MKITFDEQGLKVFAAAVVDAQKAVELQMASDPTLEGRGFADSPWEYKWGLVVRRALGGMPL